MVKRDALRVRLQVRLKDADVATEAELADEIETAISMLEVELRHEQMQAVDAMKKRHTRENDDAERARQLLEEHNERVLMLREDLKVESAAKRAQLEQRLDERRKAKQAILGESGVQELVELEADAASETAALDRELKIEILKKVEAYDGVTSIGHLLELQAQEISELESRLAAEATARKAALRVRLVACTNTQLRRATRESGTTMDEVESKNELDAELQALDDELQQQRTEKLAEAVARHKRATDAAQDNGLRASELLKEHERRKAELNTELEARAETMRSRLRQRLDTRRELNRAVLSEPGATDEEKTTVHHNLDEIEGEAEEQAAALDEQLRAERLEAVEAEESWHKKVYYDLEAARRLLEQHARGATDLESKMRVEAEAKRDALRARLETRRVLKQQMAASDVAMEAELANEAEAEMNTLHTELLRHEQMQAVVAMKRHTRRENDDAKRARELLEKHDGRMHNLREELAASSAEKRAQLDRRLDKRRKAIRDKSGVSSVAMSFELVELEVDAALDMAALDRELKDQGLKKVEAEKALQSREDGDLEAARRLRELHAHEISELESRLAAEETAHKAALRARLLARRNAKPLEAPMDEVEWKNELDAEMQALDYKLQQQRREKLKEAEKRHKQATDAARGDERRAHELLEEHERRKAEMNKKVESRAEEMRLRLNQRLNTRREIKRAVLHTYGTTDNENSAAFEKLAQIEAEAEEERTALDEQISVEALEADEAEAMRHRKVHHDLEAARRLLEQHASDAADLESRLRAEAEAKRDVLRVRLETRRNAKHQVAATGVAAEVELAEEAEAEMNILGTKLWQERMHAVDEMQKRHTQENKDAERARQLLEEHNERMRKLREELTIKSQSKRAKLEQRLQARLGQSATWVGALSKKVAKYEGKIRTTLEKAGNAEAETKRVKLREFLQFERTEVFKDLEELAEFQARAKAKVEQLDKKMKTDVSNAVEAEAAKQKQADAALEAAAKSQELVAKETVALVALESRLEAEAAVMRQKLQARLALRKDVLKMKCESSTSTPAEVTAAEAELAAFDDKSELAHLDKQLQTNRQNKLIEAKAEQQVCAWAFMRFVCVIMLNSIFVNL